MVLGAALVARCKVPWPYCQKEELVSPTCVPFRRSSTVLLLFALLFGLLALGPTAQVRAEVFDDIVFHSDFESLTSGALGTTPVAVAIGTVLAAPVPVQVAKITGLEGQAITVTGAGAAALRFSTYPGKLPQASNSRRYELRVRTDLVAPAVSVKGAGLYLMTAGGERFEIVSFGADGKLARNNIALPLAYRAGSRVRIDARFDLKTSTAALKFTTGAGILTLETLSMPVSFNPDTVGALLFAADGATGNYGLDNTEVTIQKETLGDTPAPAKIVINPPSANSTSIETINGVTLISFNFTLQNSGGRAKAVYLTLNVDDTQLDLLDLSWLRGVGYVKELKAGQIVIGIGEYDAIRKEPYDLKFKFKLKRKHDNELKLDLKYRLDYSDSRGRHTTPPLVIIVVVPPAAAVPTGVPATNVPTRTGTPATVVPTTTNVPATPTTTNVPATPTPSTEGPSPTPTTTRTP